MKRRRSKSSSPAIVSYFDPTHSTLKAEIVEEAGISGVFRVVVVVEIVVDVLVDEVLVTVVNVVEVIVVVVDVVVVVVLVVVVLVVVGSETVSVNVMHRLSVVSPLESVAVKQN